MSPAPILLLHGLGHDPARGVAELAAALPPDAMLLAPPGSLLFQEGPGRAWFGVSFTEKGPVADVAQEAASRAEILALAADTKPLIIGFGQGGVVALTAFLQQPDRFAGCALVSGRVLAEALPDLPPTAAHAGKPLFWAHGRADPAIPYAMAEQGRALLAPYGLALTVQDHDEGHVLSPDSAAALRSWIDDLMAR